MKAILALDIGTTSISAAMVNANGNHLLATESLPNDATVAHLPATEHEQDPERIFNLCAKVCRNVIRQAQLPRTALTAVAITGQMHGLLLYDPRHDTARTHLISWRDQRLDPPRDLEGRRRTGCALHPGYGAATLAWLQAHDAAACRGTVAQSICDLVAGRLTGVVATDTTHAASWGLLNLGRCAWDAERLCRLGISPRLLPDLRPSCCLLGKARGAFAAAFDIAPGTRVFSPVGDNQAAVAGAACLEPGTAVVNIGTGGQVSLPSRRIRAAYPLEVRPLPHTGFLHVGATLCAGWSYTYLMQFFQQVLQQFANLDPPPEEIFAQMNRLLSIPPATDACTPHWQTTFQGTRSHPEKRATIRNLDTQNLAPDSLVRACIQGVIGEVADVARKLNRTQFDTVAISGTAAKRIPELGEMIGRALGRPARTHDGEWDALRGAAFLLRQPTPQT